MDIHLHSHFSGDAQGSLLEFCQKAQEKGIRHLCFTEHVHYYPPTGEMVLPFSLPEYFQEIRVAREAFPHLQIYTGLEAGDPHRYRDDSFSRLISDHSFDFILAGAHMFNGFFVGDEDYRKGKETLHIFQEYFQAVAEILDDPSFDVVAHLDFPKRYLQGAKDYPLELLTEILKRIIARGKGIEVNTAPLRKGCPEPCPGADILALYRSLGGEIITLGSDAHDPEEVGSGIAEGIEMLKGVGFTAHYVFKNREGYPLPL